MRSFCRSLKDGVGSEVLRFESAALMHVAACHVTLVTHGDGGWGADDRPMGRDPSPAALGATNKTTE